jgi:hypothetical protein
LSTRYGIIGLFKERARLRIPQGWLNGSNQWVNAIYGNANQANNLFVSGGYDGNLVLGHYGLDATNKSVWAVVDHNGQFAAVPEPATLLLLAAGGLSAAVVGVIRRRRQVASM